MILLVSSAIISPRPSSSCPVTVSPESGPTAGRIRGFCNINKFMSARMFH